MGLFYQPYYESQVYSYCHDAPSSGIISVGEQKDKSVALYHRQNALSGSFFLCEWEIEYQKERDITFRLIRDPANYEDIAIKVYLGSGQILYYSSESFSDCQKTTFEFELSDVKRVIVRTKPLSSLSSYLISVTGDGDVIFTVPRIIALVIVFIFMVAVTIFSMFLIIYTVRDALKKRRIRIKEREMKKLFIDTKDERIRGTLETMQHGRLENLKNKYDEDL